MIPDKRWLTPAVLGLAQEISRTVVPSEGPDLGPILADALEDAGCEDEQILKHLRTPTYNGKHYQGCWVADLLLRKRSDYGPIDV